MEIIKSKGNRTFKELVKLDTKKYRDKTGLFKIEGANLVREAVQCGVDLTMLAIDAESESAEAAQVAAEVKEKDAKIQMFYFSSQLFKMLSDTVSPQGILAVAKQNRQPAEKFFQNKAKGNFVVLDSVQDPGNVGAIMRTAEAAGYLGLISTAGSADVYSPKVVRACAGTIFRLPTLHLEKIEDAVKLLRSENKKIVCLDMAGDKAYFEAGLCEDVALVLGNEGNGVSKEAKAAADLVVKIPMKGQIESLNVAVSAAIVMYENMRA